MQITSLPTGVLSAADFMAVDNTTDGARKVPAIVDSSGTTSGIGWLKKADGTLIQWGKVSEISFTAEIMVSDDVDMPISFADTNYVVIATGFTALDDANIFRIGANPNTVSKFDWAMAALEAITVADMQFSWIAIGRWM